MLQSSPGPGADKIELVTKVTWKRELDFSSGLVLDDLRGTWGIGDIHYGPLGGLGWFLSKTWT